MGYVFLIPGFVFLGCFLVFPFFKSLVRSFTDWNAFSPDFSFVGLKNYIELFHNDEYWAAIKVNLVFAVVSTLIQTTLGFLLAFAVYYMTPKWQQFYKVALYIPVVLPASVVAVMWKFMLNKDIGLVNTLLRLVGLDNLTHAWIGEKSTALGTVIAVNTWQYIGFTMVLFYIAMMNISKDVLESAAVDGATKKDLFFNFFLPLTAGTTETNVILSISGAVSTPPIQQILDRYAGKIFVYNFVQSIPHRSGQAVRQKLALRTAAFPVHARNRCERPFCQLQNLADRVFLRSACHPVASVFPSSALQKSRLVEHTDNRFQIFHRNLLPLCNIIQGNILLLLLHRQIQHDPKRVSSLCGNHHRA